MSYHTNMEAEFEKWFEARRQASWARTLVGLEAGKPMPAAWSEGYRGWLKDGWMGAALWCIVCQKEHDGACFTTAGGKDVTRFLYRCPVCGGDLNSSGTDGDVRHG